MVNRTIRTEHTVTHYPGLDLTDPIARTICDKGVTMSQSVNLNAIADRQAITDLIYRYCRAVDRIDIALGQSIWHENGTADYGEFYRGDGRGVIDLICEQHQHTLQCSHQVSNILIEVDGDHAASEAYVTANLRVKSGDEIKQITVWSRYIDQWSRRNDHWGLEKRTAITDFDEIRDVAPIKNHHTGRRDHSDPSYSALPPIGNR